MLLKHAPGSLRCRARRRSAAAQRFADGAQPRLQQQLEMRLKVGALVHKLLRSRPSPILLVSATWQQGRPLLSKQSGLLLQFRGWQLGGRQLTQLTVDGCQPCTALPTALQRRLNVPHAPLELCCHLEQLPGLQSSQEAPETTRRVACCPSAFFIRWWLDCLHEGAQQRLAGLRVVWLPGRAEREHARHHKVRGKHRRRRALNVAPQKLQNVHYIWRQRLDESRRRVVLVAAECAGVWLIRLIIGEWSRCGQRRAC